MNVVVVFSLLFAATLVGFACALAGLQTRRIGRGNRGDLAAINAIAASSISAAASAGGCGAGSSASCG